MKWITQNYKGEEQIWYSNDVILKIKLLCQCINLDSINLSKEILEIIENEDNDET